MLAWIVDLKGGEREWVEAVEVAAGVVVLALAAAADGDRAAWAVPPLRDQVATASALAVGSASHM